MTRGGDAARWRGLGMPLLLAVALSAVVPGLLRSSVTAKAAAPAILEYPIPSGCCSDPIGLVTGPDGNLWFTEGQANRVAHMSTSGAGGGFEVPTPSSAPYGITSGPDGKLWFTETTGNNVASVTTSGTFAEYPIPTVNSNPFLITPGPDGNLWFTETGGNNVAKVTISGAITEYAVPTLGSSPSGITRGPDGNVWFTESSGNKVGKVTTSGAFTEYTVPTLNSFPGDITSGPDGNLWFIETNAVAKVTTSGAFTEYPLPAANSFPNGITSGPDGNLWLTEDTFGASKVAKMTTSGAITEYPSAINGPWEIISGPDGNLWVTYPEGGRGGLRPPPLGNRLGKVTTSGTITAYNSPDLCCTRPNLITAGPDGNVWFTESSASKVAKVTPSGAVTDYPIGVNRYPTGITTGPDGNLWVAEGPGVARVTTSGTITEYATPSPGVTQGIATGPDGNLWVTEFTANNVAKVTTSGTFTEYPLPTANAEPTDITSGPDGNLWLLESFGNNVAKVTTSGTITEYPIPTASSFPSGIASGPDGDLWFTEGGVNQVAKVTTSGAFTEYPIPTANSDPVGIAAGPDGNLWFTEFSTSKVARVTTSGTFTEYPTPTINSNPAGITAGPAGTVWFTEPGANNVAEVTASTVLPLAAVLPAMANAAYGGYTTVAEIQNTGSAPAAVAISYFDSSGAAVGSGDAIASLPVNGTWTVRQDNGHGLAAGQPGWARVYSSQRVATFVNEFAPSGGSDATSYTGIDPVSGTGSTLYAPTIVNNAYGGYTTGIGLVSLATVPTTIIVTYRDGSGTTIATQTLPGVAAGAYQGLFSGAAGLPSGFAGTATITSSAGNLAAIVNETGPGAQFSSYDAVPAGSATLYAPAALKNAYGGYNTGMGIQNTTGGAGVVTVTYYDSGGVPTTTTHSIAANGYVGVYQGTDIATAGAYTAKITSTVGIAAIVNEVAPSTTSAMQSTAYNTFPSGAATLHLPLVESTGSDGWSTGEGIMNTGATATTVTVTYYDTTTGSVIGTAQTQSLQPNAYWGLYQPLGGLPAGDRASAVVTTSSGGQVAAICNESNATSFMSYEGQ